MNNSGSTVIQGDKPNDDTKADGPLTSNNEACYHRNKTLVSQYIRRILPDFPTPSERYYDIRLVSCQDKKSYFGEVGDQCVMLHSNRICLITLAPTHPIIQEDKTISKIEYTFEGFEKIDRLTSQPKGRLKKGGHKLQKYAPLCAISCSDNTKYVILACIPSRLVEINSTLLTNPDIMKTKPLSSGFIAIVLPNNWKRLEEIRVSLPKLGQQENLELVDPCED